VTAQNTEASTGSPAKDDAEKTTQSSNDNLESTATENVEQAGAEKHYTELDYLKPSDRKVILDMIDYSSDRYNLSSEYSGEYEENYDIEIIAQDIERRGEENFYGGEYESLLKDYPGLREEHQIHTNQ